MNETEPMLADTEQPRETENKQEPAQSGAAALREAAHIVLLDDGPEIALGLKDGSLKGHLQCLRFLYKLAELRDELGGGRDGTEKVFSLAEELAAEMQWKGESSEEDAEDAGCSREPEG